MTRTPIMFAILTLVATVGGSRLMAATAPPDMPDVPLTLTGCVVAGEARDSYLLTNVVVDGTRMAPINAFYRFNTTKGLKEQVGRRVEVKGKADLDDHDKGTIEMKVEDGKATTAVTSERRTVKVDQNIWGGSDGALKMRSDIATYKFEVEEIKRLAGNCASAAEAR